MYINVFHVFIFQFMGDLNVRGLPVGDEAAADDLGLPLLRWRLLPFLKALLEIQQAQTKIQQASLLSHLRVVDIRHVQQPHIIHRL